MSEQLSWTEKLEEVVFDLLAEKAAIRNETIEECAAKVDAFPRERTLWTSPYETERIILANVSLAIRSLKETHESPSF